MKILSLYLAIILVLKTPTILAQTDSVKTFDTVRSNRHFREVSSTILAGIHLQENEHPVGTEYLRKYVEIGLHRTILTNYAVFTHGPSILFSPERQSILGLKYGAWTNVYFLSIGASGTYYTDFKGGGLMFKPEVGLGIRRVRLAVGFNLSVFSNTHFRYMTGGSHAQFMLNYLFRRKVFKRA